MNKEVFIERAVGIHGDRFDYSLVPDEIPSKEKVQILCKVHGLFHMTAGNHLSNKRGCAKCGFGHVASIKTQRSKEQFFSFAPILHEFKFDYSLVEFKNKSTKVKIICPIHGEFEQTPESHMNGLGCRKCGREVSAEKQRDSTETFIEKAKNVHGDLYDYSKCVYVNQQTKVDIICKTHGVFSQKPSNHITGKNGCPVCLPDTLSKANRSDENEVFEKVKNLIESSGNKLVKFEYKNSNSFCEIECPKHGIFKQRIRAILDGFGCQSCGIESSAQMRSKSVEHYVPKFKELFGEKYDYSDSVVINSKTRFSVLCKEHGKFATTISNHIRGKGCPKCAKYQSGFKSSLPATFYILKITDDVIKFGISNKFNHRFRQIKNKSCFDISVLYRFEFEDGQVARDIETEILFSDIKRSVVSPADMKSGHTETCYISDISKIFAIVDKYKDQLK